MPRYHKIFAGPVTEATPQVCELRARESILPGCLCVVVSGAFALADPDATGNVWIAQDNYPRLGSVDEAWVAGEHMIGMSLLDEQFFNGRIADGVNITEFGTPLALGSNGMLAVASPGDRVIGHAEEIFNNISGSSQLIRFRP